MRFFACLVELLVRQLINFEQPFIGRAFAPLRYQFFLLNDRPQSCSVVGVNVRKWWHAGSLILRPRPESRLPALTATKGEKPPLDHHFAFADVRGESLGTHSPSVEAMQIQSPSVKSMKLSLSSPVIRMRRLFFAGPLVATGRRPASQQITAEERDTQRSSSISGALVNHAGQHVHSLRPEPKRPTGTHWTPAPASVVLPAAEFRQCSQRLRDHLKLLGLVVHLSTAPRHMPRWRFSKSVLTLAAITSIVIRDTPPLASARTRICRKRGGLHGSTGRS